MAVLHSLLLLSTLVLSAAVQAVVRREQSPQMVLLDPAGNAEHATEELLGGQIDDGLGVPTQCNRQFLEMAEGKDECTGSGNLTEILYDGDCTHAAESLKLTKATNYFLDDHEVNPQPYPKGCFVNTSTNLVHYNPQEANTSGITISGKKICMRDLYASGTHGTNPKEGCTGDATPVLTYDNCLAASLCAAGGGACKILQFKDNVDTYKKDDMPIGCFRDAIGCWGFNNIAIAPTNPVNGTPVCINVAPAPSAF